MPAYGCPYKCSKWQRVFLYLFFVSAIGTSPAAARRNMFSTAGSLLWRRAAVQREAHRPAVREGVAASLRVLDRAAARACQRGQEVLPALARLCCSLHFRALHTPFSQQGGWLLRHRVVLTTSCKTVVFRCRLVTGSPLAELQMFRAAASLARSVALSPRVTSAAASCPAAAAALATMHVIGPYMLSECVLRGRRSAHVMLLHVLPVPATLS
jgi:hypothetical protein